MGRYKVILLLALCCCHHLLAAQLELFYRVGAYELTPEQENTLTSYLDSLDGSAPYHVEIWGFADKLGSPESNLTLSQNRAKRVSAYLRQHYPDLVDSVRFEGMGEVESSEAERRLHRKVRLEFVAPGAEVPIDESELTLNFPGLEVGRIYEIEGLHFKTGRTILLKESFPKIKQLFLWLKKNRTISIEIQGHVCCSMSSRDPFMQQLSTGRARVIHDILIKSGVDPKRLSFKGYGFSRPKVFPEKSEADQQANRRVEIRILKM